MLTLRVYLHKKTPVFSGSCISGQTCLNRAMETKKLEVRKGTIKKIYTEALH